MASYKRMYEKSRYLFAIVDLLSKSYASPRNPGKLNKTQQITLLQIGDHSGKTFKDIHANINIDKGAFSRVVQSLIQKGYVKRTTCRNDRRMYTLELTKQGLQEAHTINEQLFVSFKESISQISTENRNELFSALATIEQVVKEWQNLIES